MAQSVRCLLLKHQGLTSDPQRSRKELSLPMGAYSPKLREADVGSPWGLLPTLGASGSSGDP